MDQDLRELLNDVNADIIKFRGAYSKWAKNNGISYHELLVLYSMCTTVSCTQKDICNSYFLPKQTVNNIILTLMKSGKIELIPDKLAVNKTADEYVCIMKDMLLNYGNILESLF